jgi:hypothetical protein
VLKGTRVIGVGRQRDDDQASPGCHPQVQYAARGFVILGSPWPGSLNRLNLTGGAATGHSGLSSLLARFEILGKEDAGNAA